MKKAGSDQASGGCSLGIQDGPRGREELFLEVRAKNVCGWLCVYEEMCAEYVWGHGEYEIEICFVCMV